MADTTLWTEYDPADHTPDPDGEQYDFDTRIVGAHRLWVHPAVPYDAETIAGARVTADDAIEKADRETIEWPCPACGEESIGVHAPLIWADMDFLDGVGDCPCGEPQFAHQGPPQGFSWDPDPFDADRARRGGVYR